MELFNNYQDAYGYFCDITPETDYLDPIARIACFGAGIGIGTIECPDINLQSPFWSCNDQVLWNCNLCGNDRPFWIPFTDGDTFDFQFQQLFYSTNCLHPFYPENLVTGGHTASASYEIYTCCDDTVFEITEEMHNSIVEEEYVGEFFSTNYDSTITGHPIQMVRFNLDAIKEYMIDAGLEPCFYIIWRFPRTNACLPEGDVIKIYTEPFKYRECEQFPYIYNVESTYTYLDCYGNYYGNNFSEGLGNSFVYSNRIRIPGSFEQLSFNITKDKIETSLKTTAMQICENWVLKTTHLPIGFAKFVTNVLAGKNVLIDGTEYQIEGDLTRNNDVGSQFYMEIPAQNCNCSKSLSCE